MYTYKAVSGNLALALTGSVSGDAAPPNNSASKAFGSSPLDTRSEAIEGTLQRLRSVQPHCDA